jgi:uncharacterized protein YecT (DUF1311 family)
MTFLVSTPRATAQYMSEQSAPAACLNAQSNTATGECFGRMAKEADLRLNQVYNEIQKFFEAGHRQKDGSALRTAQRQWIAFRDANCQAAEIIYEQGTAGPVNGAACLEATTRQRTEELEMEYGWLLQK